VGLQQQPGGGGQQLGPLVQPGQVLQYQTHVFTPVVTGAPMKKPKYSVSGSSIGGGGRVGALAAAGGGGPAGAGGKSLLTLAGFSFRVSLCSFVRSRVPTSSMLRIGHRLSVLASGDFQVFLLNTLFAISGLF
jgi:hypothetical protein